MENEKQPIQVEGQPQNQMPTTPPAVKPDNYLVWAILSTLFCCMPFGVISIIYATHVDNFWAMGQYAIAESTAQKAKKWLWAAIGSGFAIWLFYVIYIFAIVGLSAFAELL